MREAGGVVVSRYVYSFMEDLHLNEVNKGELLNVLREKLEFDCSKSLEDIFGWYGLILSEEGESYKVRSICDELNAVEIEDLFKELAPYMRSGSSLAYSDDCSEENWQFLFNNGELKVQHADSILLWDENIVIDNVTYDEAYNFTVAKEEDALKLTQFMKREGIAFNISCSVLDLLENNSMNYTIL